jgi:hypothetical protein
MGMDVELENKGDSPSLPTCNFFTACNNYHSSSMISLADDILAIIYTFFYQITIN